MKLINSENELFVPIERLFSVKAIVFRPERCNLSDMLFEQNVLGRYKNTMTGNGVELKKTERSLINLKLGAYIRNVTIFVF